MNISKLKLYLIDDIFRSMWLQVLFHKEAHLAEIKIPVCVIDN